VAPPFVGVAVNVTLVPAQMVVAEAEILTLTGELVVTVVLIVFDVAGFPVTQVSLEVRTTYTASPFDKVEVVYVFVPVPTADPPSYHWYAGVAPPLVGVAVNVTELPSQIEPEGEAAIETLTGTAVRLVSVTVFEVGEVLAPSTT